VNKRRDEKSGVFISFEGIEGSGKSTQIERLKTHLEQKGYTVVVTREPGGTPVAEAIRQVLLDPQHAALCETAELLLYEAARAQHVAERIAPALQAGHVVLCDRFADSTTAYQRAGRGLAQDVVEPLHTIATGGLDPDLTILIDLPVETGLARATRGAADRMEREPQSFHERVRAGFLELAEENPERVKMIDGTRSVDEIADAIAALVDAFLKELEVRS